MSTLTDFTLSTIHDYTSALCSLKLKQHRKLKFLLLDITYFKEHKFDALNILLPLIDCYGIYQENKYAC